MSELFLYYNMRMSKKNNVLKFVLSAFLLTGCFSRVDTEVSSTGIETDFSAYEWVSEPYCKVIELSLPETVEFFHNQQTGILYLGKLDCPFCNRAVPVLNETAYEENMTVYYSDTDVQLSENNISYYNELVSYLGDILPVNNNVRDIYVPLVAGIKDGVTVAGHTGIFDEYVITDENEQLTSEEAQTLKDIYLEIIDQIRD